MQIPRWLYYTYHFASVIPSHLSVQKCIWLVHHIENPSVEDTFYNWLLGTFRKGISTNQQIKQNVNFLMKSEVALIPSNSGKLTSSCKKSITLATEALNV